MESKSKSEERYRIELIEADGKRLKIEAEIEELMQQIPQDLQVPTQDDLLTEDNFPRADIDVYNIRMARNRIAQLLTDHRSLMSVIEKKLSSHFSGKGGGGKEEEEEEMGEKTMSSSDSSSYVPLKHRITPAKKKSDSEDYATQFNSPFLIVDEISSDSPAMSSGLQLNDKILFIGSCNSHNYSSQLLARLVRNSTNQPLDVRVLRTQYPIKNDNDCSSNMTCDRVVSLTLVPHEWTGNGLLGCHLSPITSIPNSFKSIT